MPALYDPNDEARKRLLQLMQQSIQPLPPEFTARKPINTDNAPAPRVSYGANGLSGLKPPPSQPMAGGVRLPGIEETNPVSESNPYEGYTPERKQPAPINVRVGANTTGMSPIDRSVAVLDTERQAAQNYPSSKVSPTGEVLPPKMHHGFWDRIKSISKGALQNLNKYSETHPNATQAELIGALGGGGIKGGINPTAVDRDAANARVQRDTGLLGQQLEIEKMRQQVGQGAQFPKPIYETRSDEDGNEIRQQYNPKTGQLEDVIGPDGKPVIVKRALPRTSVRRPPILRERHNADGTTTTLKSDDNGETWKPVDDLTSAAPPGKADTSEFTNEQINKVITEKQSERELIDQRLATIPKEVPSDIAGQTMRNPEYDELEKRSRKLHDDITELKTKVKPTPRGAKPKSAPTTHGFSIGRWMSDPKNKGKTEADARAYAAANYPGYAVIP